ncbi:MAG: helix-turn-helix transcriptional regulator, partial [Clostridia bacterium]|nr:helix-turn-helix transcriptional regulator [Clostridia bacterium]
MTLGQKLHLFRSKAGLSQEDVAGRLLVSRQTVSQWEKDQTMPTVDNLLRLRELFGVSLDE